MSTLRQLEYLVAIADLRNFGRAAQACNVSQPTLSQQLRSLEDSLGVILIERNTTGADLTPIGRDITARARRLLVEAQDIRDVARRAGDRLAGTLRLGVTPTLGPYLMPPIVAALHREQPDLRLHIKEGIPDDQALALSRGALDMLLGPLPIAGSDLNVQPLFRERLFVVAASDHPLTKLQNLRCEHLQGAHVLSLDRRHHLHREVATICTAFGMELLRDYEGTSLDSIHQMSASGIGLAILPELYIRSDVAGRTGVAVLQPEGWHFTRSIAAAWRSGAAYGDAYRMIAERIGTEASALTGANGGLFRE
ncbi:MULTISPECIES: hydrogen peroxide-inducible genes activator [Alphaproteobacteria]|uniref:Hydrogen peroxide-inducible genes activator n=1 Tax=Sphingopyxis bauzanensis TaxID=651663 RepID=A0A246JT49_9SPHN|nr:MULTISPECIES: hydrogen peroxide-inducible genes activator [Sphingopyxis]KGB57727.1 Bacterial regulatory helix-turn-helix, lysR family protein [Sphingopyxis sp. LC363]OWQ96148.1 hydrogen peroxide-inducible genes activator [Sphingopyxis bauzanensis]GGJ38726.1 hyaluronan synthase [Sphingopyxis bauzanensis]